MKLTDAQWAVIEPLIPQPSKRADGRGRPRRSDREVLEGILWVLRTGAQWDEMPDRFPPKSTCHDHFQEWNRTGVLVGILKALAEDLHVRGELNLSECFVDAELIKQGIEMIAPHRSNRKRPKTQDGRKLRRYKRRWKVERLFAWLQNFRRIQTRHDRHDENYLGFVLLGCLIILLRTFFG